MIPHGDNPNRYQPNPDDDRALAGTVQGAAYFEIATALDAIENIDADMTLALHKSARQAIRTAENALRRAAWITAVHAPTEDR